MYNCYSSSKKDSGRWEQLCITSGNEENPFFSPLMKRRENCSCHGPASQKNKLADTDPPIISMFTTTASAQWGINNPPDLEIGDQRSKKCGALMFFGSPLQRQQSASALMPFIRPHRINNGSRSYTSLVARLPQPSQLRAHEEMTFTSPTKKQAKR